MKMSSAYSQFHANQTHFHKKDFARRLVSKQRHKLPKSEMALHAVIRTSTMEVIYIKDNFF